MAGKTPVSTPTEPDQRHKSSSIHQRREKVNVPNLLDLEILRTMDRANGRCYANTLRIREDISREITYACSVAREQRVVRVGDDRHLVLIPLLGIPIGLILILKMAPPQPPELLVKAVDPLRLPFFASVKSSLFAVRNKRCVAHRSGDGEKANGAFRPDAKKSVHC